MARKPDQQALYDASGNVRSDDPLVAFLYLLMRDEMPVGRVDRLVIEVARHDGFDFTNGLAQHARHLADELRRKANA
jgi:hypothetical protein